MRGRLFSERVAVGAFLVIPVAYLLLVAALLALGDRTPPGVLQVLTVASVASIAAGLLVLWSPRLLAAAIVLGALIALVGVGPGSFGLAHPDSFFDFLTPLATIAGALTGVVSCAIAASVRLRGAGREPKRYQRKLVLLPLLVLVAAIAFSAIESGGRVTHAGTPAGALLVELRTDKFIPSTLRLKAGERARVFVRNLDSYAHTFTIDDLAVDQYVGPRSSRLVTFDVLGDKAGSHALSCTVVGHGNMTGTVVVER